MKRTLVIWLLSISLLASGVLNVIVGKANLEYFESSYEDLAEQQVKYMEIHALIENSEVAEAKRLVEKEIEWRSGVLAICLIEGCSERAKEVLHSAKEAK